jgi:hypothetical protein
LQNFRGKIQYVSTDIDLNASLLKRMSDESGQIMDQSVTYDESGGPLAEARSEFIINLHQDQTEYITINKKIGSIRMDDGSIPDL